MIPQPRRAGEGWMVAAHGSFRNAVKRLAAVAGPTPWTNRNWQRDLARFRPAQTLRHP
jgi:hypothetical protein